MVMPVSSSHTSRGQYELVIRAADDGKCNLRSELLLTKLLFKVMKLRLAASASGLELGWENYRK